MALFRRSTTWKKKGNESDACDDEGVDDVEATTWTRRGVFGICDTFCYSICLRSQNFIVNHVKK